MKTDIKPPLSFWAIGIFALVWNIIELYITTYQMDFLQENSTAEEFQVIETVPYWYGFIFIVALFSETIGVFMLLIRKKIAVKFFAVSMISLLLVEFYWLFIVDIKKTSMVFSIVVPVVVIGVAIFLYVYSKYAAKKGWFK